MKITATITAIALAAATAATAEVNLKLGHPYDPADPVHTAANTFARVAAEESNGEVNVSVFPSAQLGKVKEMQEGVQQGFVDIVLESVGTLSSFHPLAGVESMPYLFRDADHYMRVWNGDVGEQVKSVLADEANFRIFGHLYRGSRELTSNRKIESIDDLDGLKIRVTPIKERLVTWETFGASPTPMAFSELFTALQQGVIDAQENPIATIHKNSFDEVQDYLIQTSHMANGFTFQMNATRFADFDPEVQDVLNNAAEAAAEEYNTYVKENEAKLLNELQEKGMEVIRIDRAPFRDKAKEVVAQFPDLEEWYLKMAEVE
ncbi:TRAP transporter substrate-binding protein [Roseovarius sp. MMSF_3281]|uniref:TRAP transporter substrate-binding protein n=1 Tax=Roseovarius sp. MMSF_3281 TaxID=3046694 RepID=UPI00273F57C6|nr:TRAP transporter substrate-binding protein [Roseovarius sp. MMSF_3281]